MLVAIQARAVRGRVFGGAPFAIHGWVWDWRELVPWEEPDRRCRCEQGFILDDGGIRYDFRSIVVVHSQRSRAGQEARGEVVGEIVRLEIEGGERERKSAKRGAGL